MPQCVVIPVQKGRLQNDCLTVNDRREDGKMILSKRTDTCRRLSSTEPSCPFSLAFFVDQSGFLSKGAFAHQYQAQAQVNQIPKLHPDLLTDEKRKELEDAERAHVGKSVARSRISMDILSFVKFVNILGILSRQLTARI